MRYFLLMIAVVALVGCGKKDDGNTGVVNPNKPSPKAVPVNIADPIVEKAIRKSLKKPTGKLTKEESAKVIEAAIREDLEKPTGELAKADLEKVTKLHLGDNHLTDVKGLEKLTQLRVLILGNNQLTDVKGLEKLTQLTHLYLHNNLDITKAQIEELQKALPKCKIYSDPKK